MTARTIVECTGGTAATETADFGLDDVAYEIDLSARSAEKLRRILQR